MLAVLSPKIMAGYSSGLQEASCETEGAVAVGDKGGQSKVDGFSLEAWPRPMRKRTCQLGLQRSHFELFGPSQRPF